MNMKSLVAITISLNAIFSIAGPAAADNWPNWRGPNHNGANDATNLPTTWSTTRNVLWATDMSGSSSATPIIWGDKVFVVTNDSSLKKIYALCLNRDTGAILWKKQLAEVPRQPRRNTLASPSPVTDGKLVYFTFGTGDLVALDFDGNTVWSKNLVEEYGPIGQQFGYSSSPLLYDNRLYFPLLHGQWGPGVSWSTYSDRDSYVLCLDAATGNEVWKVHRPSDAVGESFDSYASAVPYEHDGATTIIVQGGNYLTGQDPDSGEELWRQAHNPRNSDFWRLIPSPVVAGDLICGVQPRGLDAFAVLPGKKKTMAYEDSHWIYDGRTTDVTTPLYYEGRLYIVNGARKMITCLNPKNGKKIWTGDLEGSSRVWASPTAADGKIYCFDEKGTTTVVAAGDKFRILGQSALGGGITKSTIAIADNKLFIRTSEKLYCIASTDTGG